MSYKFKLISTSVAITILTSTTIIVDTHKTSANPFSNLLKNIRSVSNSLTLSNPFKTSNSINFNKPSSNGKISSVSPSKSLWSKFKGFFAHDNSKSFKISTSGTINPTFQNDGKSSTITHVLKGTQENFSKSKERRTYLMSKLENKTSPTKNIDNKISVLEKKIITNLDTFPTTKNLELESKLEILKTDLHDKFDYKLVIEDSINKTSNQHVKTALNKHLDITESQIMELQIKIENLQTLLHITQNNK